MDKGFHDHGMGGRFLEVESSFFLPLSVVFILPFLLIEFNTICSYGLRWFQMWNIMDALSYIFQVSFLFGPRPIHSDVHLSSSFSTSISMDRALRRIISTTPS